MTMKRKRNQRPRKGRNSDGTFAPGNRVGRLFAPGNLLQASHGLRAPAENLPAKFQVRFTARATLPDLAVGLGLLRDKAAYLQSLIGGDAGLPNLWDDQGDLLTPEPDPDDLPPPQNLKALNRYTQVVSKCSGLLMEIESEELTPGRYRNLSPERLAQEKEVLAASIRRVLTHIAYAAYYADTKGMFNAKGIVEPWAADDFPGTIASAAGAFREFAKILRCEQAREGKRGNSYLEARARTTQP